MNSIGSQILAARCRQVPHCSAQINLFEQCTCILFHGTHQHALAISGMCRPSPSSSWLHEAQWFLDLRRGHLGTICRVTRVSTQPLTKTRCEVGSALVSRFSRGALCGHALLSGFGQCNWLVSTAPSGCYPVTVKYLSRCQPPQVFGG